MILFASRGDSFLKRKKQRSALATLDFFPSGRCTKTQNYKLKHPAQLG